VEQEGVRRARARAAEADLVLWVTDASVAGRAGTPLAQLKIDAPQWLIRNKVDLLAGEGKRADLEFCRRPERGPKKNEFQFVFSISAERGEGLDALFGAVASFARDYFAAGEMALVTRARHRDLFEQTVAALSRALAEAAAPAAHEELIAEELRHAASALGRLTGRIDVEDVLDKIFREFCIGK
jgi:tRNA modification GTPase